MQAGDSLEAVLAREAFWHALGECMNGLTAFDEQVPFESWYQQELQGMLRASLQVHRLSQGRHAALVLSQTQRRSEGKAEEGLVGTSGRPHRARFRADAPTLSSSMCASDLGPSTMLAVVLHADPRPDQVCGTSVVGALQRWVSHALAQQVRCMADPAATLSSTSAGCQLFLAAVLTMLLDGSPAGRSRQPIRCLVRSISIATAKPAGALQGKQAQSRL